MSKKITASEVEAAQTEEEPKDFLEQVQEFIEEGKEDIFYNKAGVEDGVYKWTKPDALEREDMVYFLHPDRPDAVIMGKFSMTRGNHYFIDVLTNAQHSDTSTHMIEKDDVVAKIVYVSDLSEVEISVCDECKFATYEDMEECPRCQHEDGMKKELLIKPPSEEATWHCNRCDEDLQESQCPKCGEWTLMTEPPKPEIESDPKLDEKKAKDSLMKTMAEAKAQGLLDDNSQEEEPPQNPAHAELVFGIDGNHPMVEEFGGPIMFIGQLKVWEEEGGLSDHFVDGQAQAVYLLENKHNFCEEMEGVFTYHGDLSVEDFRKVLQDEGLVYDETFEKSMCEPG